MTREEAFALLCQSIETGEEADAHTATTTLLALNVPPTDITATMAQVMQRLGEQFHRLEIYVPDLLLAADAFEAAMNTLRPALMQLRGDIPPKGIIILGVVEGDIHTLGKDLVRAMLAADGFEVVDLGRDVKAAAFVDEAQRAGANIIALSALMTTTMLHMQDVVALLCERGIRESFRVIIGGAPVTPHFADEIGADGYAEDASTAVILANRLLKAFVSERNDSDRA